MDANELANVARVCCIAVKKVLALCERARDNLFSHRDLNDGNIMIRLRDERVRAEEDVDVWLFDFGKSMAIVDGERISAGIWDANGEQRIFAYNPTTDVVRILSNVTRSLVESYTGKKKTAPGPVLRNFLAVHAPFAEQMAEWFAHATAAYGSERVAAMWEEEYEGKIEALSEARDYLDFAARPSFKLMRAYYCLPEEQWCAAVRPEAVLAYCHRQLAKPLSA